MLKTICDTGNVPGIDIRAYYVEIAMKNIRYILFNVFLYIFSPEIFIIYFVIYDKASLNISAGHPPADECTFCITFSFKTECYAESTLIHRGCLTVISRLDL